MDIKKVLSDNKIVNLRNAFFINLNHMHTDILIYLYILLKHLHFIYYYTIFIKDKRVKE